MKFLIVSISALIVACSAGHLVGSDWSSLQSMLASRSDSQLSQQWPHHDQYHSSLTSFVHSPVAASTLPHHDDINARLLKQWQDEQLTARLSALSYPPSQHLTNEHLSLTSLAHTPSYLPQYADLSHLNTNFDQHWQTEQQLHSPLSLTHAVASSSTHTTPTALYSQPYGVEKQISILVPVPVDRYQTVIKPYPVYVHQKQPEINFVAPEPSYWQSPPQSNPHFQYKRHSTRGNPNPNGFFIRKRAQFNGY